MKRQEAIDLNNGITGPQTKFKTGMNALSNPSYVGIMRLKNELKKFFESMYDEEKQLAESFEDTITIGPDAFKAAPQADKDKVKDFFGKLVEIQKREFHAEKLNFIPIEELRKSVEDCDNQTSLILGQYLLKDDGTA